MRKWRIFGFGLIIAYIILAIIIGIVYLSNPIPSINLNNYNSPMTFQIPFAFNINNSIPIGPQDISVGINMTYPNGTLYTNEIVTVYGVATLNTPIAQGVRQLSITFQNSLTLPIIKDSNGIIQPANIFLNPEPSNSSVLVGSGRVEWAIAGNYQLLAGMEYHFSNGTTESFYLGPVVGPVIQVSPQNQALAQQEQLIGNKINSESLYLTVALLGLTVIGAFASAKEFFTDKQDAKLPLVENSYQAKSNTESNFSESKIVEQNKGPIREDDNKSDHKADNPQNPKNSDKPSNP